MARLARSVFSGIPHHVTQWGNGRQQVFFGDEDYEHYRNLLARHCAAHGVSVWAWVMMPNHVHLILNPADAVAISRAMARVHRDYASYIHARTKRTGHFWQGRFGCVAMDEAHLATAVRYVVMNPVRAGLAKRAEEWRWSSVHAHLGRATSDGLTDPAPVASRIEDFAGFLRSAEDEAMTMALRKSETIGRPVGSLGFIEQLEGESGRTLRAAKRGPKLKGHN